MSTPLVSRIASPIGTPAFNTPGQTPNLNTVSPSNTTDTPRVETEQDINWDKVDEAMKYFQEFDVMELSSFVVNKAIEKGPKDIYNEAGPVRFKVSQAKQMYKELASSICSESLASKQASIEALKRSNAAKSWMGDLHSDGE